MLNRLRNRLTYANAMSSLAVFIALGGTTYAAISLPAHSVGTRQLKTHAVTGTRLAAGAVSSSKVRANSLTGQQINESSLGPVPNAATLAGETPAQLLIAARLRCPVATDFLEGVCIESSPRAAQRWGQAASICAGAGRELPRVVELSTRPAAGGVEWTGDAQNAPGAVFTVNLNTSAISVADAGSAVALPFRCVAQPSN